MFIVSVLALIFPVSRQRTLPGLIVSCLNSIFCSLFCFAKIPKITPVVALPIRKPEKPSCSSDWSKGDRIEFG